MRLYRILIALALTAAVLPSCGGGGGGGGGGPTDSFDRHALLSNLANNLVLPVYADCLAKAQALQTAVQDYAAELLASGPDITVKQAAAQQAWRDAIDGWERAELLSFGPAGSSATIVGGLDLRDEIYSWPTHNTIRIDEEIIANEFGNANFFDVELVNVYGLDAVEYLLFHTGPDNSAPPDHPMNMGGTWTALGQATIDQRRADYAAACSGDVVTRAQQLQSAWLATGGNFVGIISSAGTTGLYSSAHAAVNDVFAAMFYLDTMVKDKKIADPAGISGGPVDPSIVESAFASTSKEHLLRNLETFQIMFLGNDPMAAAGVGFDDFLVARGAPGLATTMATDIAQAIAAVNAIPGTLQDALVNNFASVQAAHAAIKDITDNLKSQFVTVLNLSVPDTGAGDND